ncbi:hypothetical protein GCM10010428_55140 [Actinosynnema pretiosum subsp. pretiosum]
MMVPHGLGLLATTEERAACTLERAAFVFLPLVMSASGHQGFVTPIPEASLGTRCLLTVNPE